MTIYENVASSFGLTKGSVIREIQQDAIDESVSASLILRKARLAAKKLGVNDFSRWINQESDGYSGVVAHELPSYRRLSIEPKFFNPYNGWCPIIIDDAAMYEACHTGFMKQSVQEIEALSQTDGSLMYCYPNELCRLLRRGMRFAFDIRPEFEIRGFAHSPQLRKIPNAVRNILLDWAIDLERAGVLGEGLGFSVEDRNQAAAVTQTIYAQNIGNIGNASSGASVQTAIHSNNAFSLSSVDDYLGHIRAALPGVPDETRAAVEAELQKLISAKNNRQPSFVKGCLKSIQTICEGAAGSLAAQGIAAFLSGIL